MSGKLPLTAFILAVVAGGLIGCRSTGVQSAGGPAPVPVSVAVASQESVPVEVRAVGTVESSAVIQVKSQVSGELVRVAFAEGGDVNKGDLLFEIDPRVYQQALRQAEAAEARDQALLRQAEANLARDIAQSKSLDADAGRYQQLAREGVVSRAQNDQTSAASEAIRASISADRAAIESTRASIESDRAAIERARLDLSYCEIHSPVSGRAGNLLVHAGNLIGANGQNAMVTIHQLEPIWVSFGVPEEHLTELRKRSAARTLAVRAVAQDNPKEAADGSLSVIDNTVDANTGTIRLKATFENNTHLLWPGQFVNVAVTLNTLQNAVVVPGEAVQPGQRGQMVYVVKPDQTVEPRNVTVGREYGTKVIIEKGVSAGETVVTDGQLRLVPGAKIKAVPAGKIDSEVL